MAKNKAVYSLDEVLQGTQISNRDDLENVLLEQVQQAQEVILLIEDDNYAEAIEQLEGIEAKLNSVKQFITNLENGDISEEDDEAE